MSLFQKILRHELHRESGEYTYFLACGHKVQSFTAPMVWVGEIYCSQCETNIDKLNILYSKLSNSVNDRDMESIEYYVEKIKSLNNK